MKQTVRLNENQLKQIIKESIEETIQDYAGNYDELIKTEMFNLADLERKVPQWIKPETHSTAAPTESILQQIQRKRCNNF